MFCRKRPCFYLLCTMKAAPGMARPGRFYPPRLPAPTTPAALRYRASGEGNQPPPGSPPGKCLSGHPFPSSTAHRQSQNVVRHAARQGFPPTSLRAAGPRLDGPRDGQLVKRADGRLRRGRETRLVRQAPSKTGRRLRGRKIRPLPLSRTSAPGNSKDSKGFRIPGSRSERAFYTCFPG